MDLQPASYIVQQVESIPACQQFQHHVLLTRFDGRIDILNTMQNMQITTSFFAPSLNLYKSVMVFIDGELNILTCSPQLPSQLLLFKPGFTHCVRTFALDFGQLVDIEAVGQFVYIAFSSGMVAEFELSTELQYKRSYNTQYKVNRIQLSAEKDIIVSAENHMVHLRDMKPVRELKHGQYIRSAVLTNDTYIVHDRSKITLYDQQLLNVFVYISQIQIQRIVLVNDFLAVLAGGLLKLFKVSEGKLTEMIKTQAQYTDLIGFILTESNLVSFNQVGQFFTLPHKFDITTIQKQFVMLNKSYLEQSENTICYLSQNGIDLVDVKDKKILVRMEMQNMFQNFQKIVKREQTTNKLNSNMIQDICTTQIDENNYLVIISEQYTTQTKFMLLNTTDNCCINLLKIENEEPKKIPACLKIQKLGDNTFCLIYDRFLVKVKVDLDADNIVEFLLKKDIGTKINYTNVQSTIMGSDMLVSCFTDSWYVMRIDEHLNVLQQIKQQQVNAINHFNEQVYVIANQMNVLNKNLEFQQEFAQINQVVSFYNEKIYTYKGVYQVKDNTLAIIQKEKHREYRFGYGGRWTFRFHENDAFGGYVYILTKINDHTKFDRIQ
ncbi:Conserved_hypothetical protein [Hexamita inflata]|uniref:Uncharacterized protein n=1 Tax=Hexamita inflata TaxID=28002 RepID=A0AA86TYP1_9EUKA|nr:Conserved hypothetical protein [Hexamita inflata]